MVDTAPSHQMGLAALLSLSQVAASAQPIAIPSVKQDPSSLPRTLASQSALKHRRLSSTGQTRRRLSEARDAATRPLPSSLHSAASAFATLSLSPPASTSPATRYSTANPPRPVPIPQPYSKRGALANSLPNSGRDNDVSIDIDVDGEDDEAVQEEKVKKGGKGTGKKRGTIFRCESCSKVYRHPSCLVKHRWEHSPHWREASKFLLSKHQQVQLLEAAAILTHLAPGSSLPDDRSLWPSYLSGGLLPPPSTSTVTVNGKMTTTSIAPDAPHPSSSPAAAKYGPATGTSSSLTANMRSGSVTSSTSGPRLHNYTISNSGGAGITQLRPGLLGIPNVKTGRSTPTNDHDRARSGSPHPTSSSGVTPAPPDAAITATRPMAVPHSSAQSGADYGRYQSTSSFERDFIASSVGTGGQGASVGGWSLPRSDLRSGSFLSERAESRSRSGSARSDDEDSSEEIEMEHEPEFTFDRFPTRGHGSYGAGRGYALALAGRNIDMDIHGKKSDPPDDEWDGMDMDMDL